MAPRKRRGRSSATPAQPSLPPGSASNSAATSSHSSPLASKSDHDSASAGAGATATAERGISEGLRPPKQGQATEPNQPANSKIQPPALRSADPTVAAPLNSSREPSISVERTVNEDDLQPPDGPDKEHPRAEFLLNTFQESLKENGPQQDRFTVAAVAVHLYQDMINWAVSEVAVQFKRSVFLNAEAARRREALDVGQGADLPRPSATKIASRLLYSDKNVTVECSNCGSNISASRYAQHVEKCLGRGGRMSSRAASARLRASAERAEKEAAADMDDHPVRRRRHAASAEPSVDAGSFGGYSKRRKMSPVPSAGSAPASQAGSLQHSRAGLPPSGRTRASPP